MACKCSNTSDCTACAKGDCSCDGCTCANCPKKAHSKQCSCSGSGTGCSCESKACKC